MCARVRSITFACMEVVGWKDDIPEDCNATSRRGGVAGDVGELATARQVLILKKKKKIINRTTTKLSVLSVDCDEEKSRKKSNDTCGWRLVKQKHNNASVDDDASARVVKQPPRP